MKNDFELNIKLSIIYYLNEKFTLLDRNILENKRSYNNIGKTIDKSNKISIQ